MIHRLKTTNPKENIPSMIGTVRGKPPSTIPKPVSTSIMASVAPLAMAIAKALCLNK
jgi:hypothetical protein